MNNKDLANLIFPNINLTIEDLEKRYPKRNLPEGAMVTRFAPSPTGFLHTGSLFTSLVSARFAKQSGGVFYIRLEDTDTKREIEGSGESLIKQLAVFDVIPDEGYLSDSEEEIAKKVMNALTDPNRIKKDDKGNPEICMIKYYHDLFTNKEDLEKICKECKSGNRGCVECKRQLIKNICDKLKTIKEKREFYEKNPEIVDKILIEGTKKAQIRAKKIMKDIRKVMKLDYYENL